MHPRKSYFKQIWSMYNYNNNLINIDIELILLNNKNKVKKF